MTAAPTTDSAGIRRVIRALVADGWTLDRVEYGEWEPEYVSTEAEALTILDDLDDGFLLVTKGDESGWVRFVMGNEPYEVAADWTVNLKAVYAEVDSWDEV